MKQKQNIENLLEKWAKSYQVPENYFEEIKNKITPLENKRPKKKKKLFQIFAVAASIILLIGLGFDFVKQKKSSIIPYQDTLNISTQKNYITNDIDLNDIDDEIIEEYIVDNDLMDELYFEENINNN